MLDRRWIDENEEAAVAGQISAPDRRSEALLELLSGMRRGEGTETPPLDGGGAGPLRIKEFLTGIGGRNP